MRAARGAERKSCRGVPGEPETSAAVVRLFEASSTRLIGVLWRNVDDRHGWAAKMSSTEK